MSLEIKINEDIKQAMLNRDKAKLEALRAIKAALLLIKTGKDTSGEIPESLEISTLQRLVKQRKEAAEMYKSQNRMDLYEEEVFQIDIIQKYLPEQLSEEEIRATLTEIIKETGATSIKDLGKVMGKASAKFAGKADNKVVSEITRQLLS